MVKYYAYSLPKQTICLPPSSRLALTCELLNATSPGDQASFSPLAAADLLGHVGGLPQSLSSVSWPSRRCRNASSVSGRSGNR